MCLIDRRSTDLLQHFAHVLAETEDLFERVVQRHRSYSDDVGGAPVAYDSPLTKTLEYTTAPSRCAGDANGYLTPACLDGSGCDELRVGPQPVDQKFQKAGQLQRLRAQPLNAGFLEDRERCNEWCGGENRRVADLPGCNARRRTKQRLHAKASRLLVSPPSHQMRLAKDVAVMYEATANRSRARVQLLVTAPDREIGVVVMQRKWHVADRVCEIEADDAARLAGGAHYPGEVERLSGTELHARPEH